MQLVSRSAPKVLCIYAFGKQRYQTLSLTLIHKKVFLSLSIILFCKKIVGGYFSAAKI